MKKKTSKTKAKKGFSTRTKIFTLLAIILIAAGIALFAYFRHTFSDYGKSGKWVYITKDAEEQAIRDSIMTLGETAGETTIRVIGIMGDIKNVKSGAYRIDEKDRPLDIARRLLRGHQTPVKVTFNNIRTMKQLAEKVSKNMSFTSEDFLNACDTILPKHGFRKEQFPAAFIPDSYEFYWTSDAPKVVNRLLKYRNDFWTEERRNQAAQEGLTAVDVATIASIVEEESAKKSERPTIARLYMNRLQKNMLLQADPTVKFAVGNFALKRITYQHLKKVSPYNTYLNPGLPPGPIRIPEKSTLEAVLTCQKHDYLYMCAKEDFSGYHNFAKDLVTHQSNAARYQRELNRRGIK